MPFTPIVMTITPNFETRELELLNKFIGVQTESGINQIALDTNETNLYGLIIGLEIVRQDDTPVDSWIFTQNYGTIEPENYILVNPVTSNQSLKFCLYALDSSENPQVVWRSEIYQLYFDETIESGITAAAYPVYPQFVSMIDQLDNELIFEPYNSMHLYYLHNKVYFEGSTYQYINEIPSSNSPSVGVSNEWWQLVALKGTAASIFVEDTTTGLPGTNAIVTNEGNEMDVHLHFTIPRGDKGETGSNFILKGVVTELPISGVEGDAWALDGADPKTIYIWDTPTSTWKSIGPVTFSQNASNINILDSQGYFTSTNVEDALTEVQTNINLKINQTDASVEATPDKIIIRDSNGAAKVKSLIFSTEVPGYENLNHYWDSSNGTFSTQLINNVILQNGQELHIYGMAIDNIKNGDVVQLDDSYGTYVTFSKAIPELVAINPSSIAGLATQDIAPGSFGYITWFGKINNVKTYGLVDFQEIWFNTVTGGFSGTPPEAPMPKIRLGNIIKASTGDLEDGIIFVRPFFNPSTREINDIYLTTLEESDLLVYNAILSRFENKNQTELSVGNSTKLNGFEINYFAKDNDVSKLINNQKLSNALLENFVENGDFSKGTLGWSSTGADLQAINNTLTISTYGGGCYVIGPQTNESAIPNEKIYGKAMIRTRSATTTKMSLLLGSAAEVTDELWTIDNPIQDQWYTISSIVNINEYASGTFNISLLFYDDSFNSEIFEFKYFFITNLNKAFSSEFPTAQNLLDWISLYPNEWIDISVYPTKYSADDVLAKLLTKDGEGSIIDSDTVDGYHATDFSFAGHTHTYVPPNSFNMGSSTFNSTTGVVINHTFGSSTNYFVSITPTSNGNGYIGEYYVQKNNNSITVYNSGSSTTGTFDYIIKSL